MFFMVKDVAHRLRASMEGIATHRRRGGDNRTTSRKVDLADRQADRFLRPANKREENRG